MYLLLYLISWLIWFWKDSLRKKQQPPVNSTVSVPSPQQSPTFSPAITIPAAAQPTVHSLQQQQQQHSENKEVRKSNCNVCTEFENCELNSIK